MAMWNQLDQPVPVDSRHMDLGHTPVSILKSKVVSSPKVQLTRNITFASSDDVFSNSHVTLEPTLNYYSIPCGQRNESFDARALAAKEVHESPQNHPKGQFSSNAKVADKFPGKHSEELFNVDEDDILSNADEDDEFFNAEFCKDAVHTGLDFDDDFQMDDFEPAQPLSKVARRESAPKNALNNQSSSKAAFGSAYSPSGSQRQSNTGRAPSDENKPMPRIKSKPSKLPH